MSSGVTSIQSQFNLNSGNSENERGYEFENFRLDAAHLMLYKDEQPVALAPKVIETLVALVERRGELVSKEEMMKRLWADAFVEESNLTQNIYLLRKTLGKAADGRDLIETFRRRGYRFTGAIKKAESVAAGREISAAGSPAENELPPIENAKNAANEVFSSLAILPLTNESEDETAEYLSDGVTESIINRLSQFSRLRVVARTTAFRYKNQTIEPREVGRDLGVSAVLTGRVLQFGERLIVRTELVDAANGWQIWGGQYDRPAADVLELQEIIAREISENLHLKLTGEEQKRLTKRYTESSEAYHLYIKGRYFLNKRLTETIERAAEFFQQATRVDPNFAPAYVGLADCYPLLSLYGALTPHEAYPKAKAAAEKALEIDDRYTKAYNSLGVVKLFYEWDWTGAENAFRQAIRLNPGYPDAHQRYGMFLTAVGRFDEAVAEFKRARDLDPLSLITITISGYPFYYSRRFEEAEECFREVIAMDADYSMAHFRLGLTYAQRGKYEDAIAEIQRAIVLSDDRDSIAARAYVQSLAGEAEKAEAALAELDEREKAGFVTSYNRALIEIGLNDWDAALDSLERAYEERSYWLIYLKVDPALDDLRGHPRFAALLEKVFGAENSQTARRDEKKSIKPMTTAAEADNRKWYFGAGAIAAVGLILLAAFTLKNFLGTKSANNQAAPTTTAPNLKITRLTPDIYAYNPAISPDGRHLAYAEFEDGKYSLRLKETNLGNPAQLLPPLAEGYKGLQFSPDGAALYYLTGRKNVPNHIVARIPFEGGTPQEIAADAISPPAVSPDGKQIAFINGKGNLLIVNVDGSGERVLKQRDNKIKWFNGWDSVMSWSPDGTRIAICGGYHEQGRSVSELIEISVSDGAERRIPTPPNWREMSDAVWRAGGAGLLVNVRETQGQPFQIWSISYPNGETRRITNDLHDYNWFSASADSRMIVAEQYLGNLNIWTAASSDVQNVKQLTFGKAAKDGVSGIAVLPDGKIVYSSTRNGNLDLWVMDADGKNQRQLSQNTGGWNSRPRATQDGRYIVFVSSRTGTSRIWRMDADGGNPKQLTAGSSSGGGYETRPSVSHDEAWVYYTSDEGSDTSTIWRVSIAGGEPARVSAHNRAWASAGSPDGNFVAYNHNDFGATNPWKIGVMPAPGGEPLKLFDIHVHHGILDWTADSKSLVYIKGIEKANLWQQPLDGSPPRPFTNFDSERILNFAFSPDYKQIVFSRGNDSTEAVLIENF